jgi:hypothetical protein
VSAGLLSLVSACAAGPVTVAVPDLTALEARVCTRLVAHLPERVDSASRRQTEPSSAVVAAWGESPIVLRCGVPLPPGFDEFALCQETNGVGWYVPERRLTGTPESITMTTIDRSVNIEVTLPPEHWPPAIAMVDLAPAIRRYVDQTDACV